MSFLISSQRSFERDALSESFYVISDVLGYKVRPLKSRIPGLSILSLTDSNINLFDVIDRIRQYTKTNGPLVACLKIVPLESLFKTNMDNIVENAVSLAQLKIKPNHSWRIRVKKRQTNLRTSCVIENIAKKVNWGVVNLTNPNYEIRVEIIRDLTGISVMEPKFELRNLNQASND
ncbi:MAG: THUMP domain-containing protein [Candidatus Hodarchaeota archaeon]